MATNFPSSLDNLTSPSANSQENVISHAGQHANANDSINALETKVGVDSSAVTTTLDYKLKNSSSIDPGHHHTNTTLDSIASSKVTGVTFPSGTIVGTSDSQTLTNKTITDSGSNVMAKSLKSATTTVDVSAATAPSSGQVLTATGSTAATWQTPALGLTFASTGAQTTFTTTSTTLVDVTGVTLTINPTKTVTVQAVISGRIYISTSTANIEIKLLIDGATIQDYTHTPTAVASGVPFCLSGQASVASGARIIKMQVATGNGSDAANVDQANLSVIWG